MVLTRSKAKQEKAKKILIRILHHEIGEIVSSSANLFNTLTIEDTLLGKICCINPYHTYWQTYQVFSNHRFSRIKMVDGELVIFVRDNKSVPYSVRQKILDTENEIMFQIEALKDLQNQENEMLTRLQLSKEILENVKLLTQLTI